MKNGLFIDEFNNKYYYKDNKLHRKNGPAIEYLNKDKSWYQNGCYHRIDGPAIEFFTINYKTWYYHGELINCSSQEEFERLIKLKIFW